MQNSWNPDPGSGDDTYEVPLTTRLDIIERHIASMAENWMEKFHQQTIRIAELETMIRRGVTPAEEPTMPPLEELTKLGLQIFHSPALGKKDRQSGKSEWSAKLTIYAPSRRKTEPNIALFPGRRFYCQVMERNQPPEHTVQFASSIEEDETIWAGMMRRITKKQGNPFMPNLFLVLTGHLIDEPHAELHYDGNRLVFTGWRPAAGTRENKALWYAECRR